MGIKFQCEPVLQVKPEMEPMLEDHYQELTLHKDKIKLAPDWELYDKMEKTKNFYLLTARLEEQNNMLVGYSAWFVKTHIHYKETIVAANDVLFLHKDFRQGMLGIKLIKYSEQEMKKYAHKITWHVKGEPDFRPILHRMGYIDEDVIVGKMLI
jgi:hypothetical protein